jgi:RNA polymerase sigma factor (sigma-70 family)
MERWGSRQGAGRAAEPGGTLAQRGRAGGALGAGQAVGSRAAGAASDLEGTAHSRELPIRASELVDERLARQVARGSQRAFATIYERYHQELYRYCYSLVRDRDDAYDALQSTLLRAFAALRREQRDAPLRPWLYRIAHNEAVSVIRRRPGVSQPVAAREGSVPSAEDLAGERARLALLVADLQALSERERGVLLMRELSGLSHREIALALEISVHTVKHAILAARRSLRECEDGRSMSCADVRASVSDGHGGVFRTRAHLRNCRSCAEFAAEIRARRADLRALTPPLAPAAAAGLLASLHGAMWNTAGGAGASLAGKTTYALLSAKALAGVAVVAVTGASVAGAVAFSAVGSTTAGRAAPTISAASRGHRRASPGGARFSLRAKARASAGLPASATPEPGDGAASSTPGATGTPAGDGAVRGRESAQGSARATAGGQPGGGGQRRQGAGSANAGHARGAGSRPLAGGTRGGIGAPGAGSVGRARAPGPASPAGSEHPVGQSGKENATGGGEHPGAGSPAPAPGAPGEPPVVAVPLPLPRATVEGEATAGTALPGRPLPPAAQP